MDQVLLSELKLFTLAWVRTVKQQNNLNKNILKFGYTGNDLVYIAIVYACDDIDLAFTAFGYARPISQLAYTAVG